MKKLAYILLLLTVACSPEKIAPDARLNEKAVIFPDYNGVTLPVEIAPINFRIENRADKYYVEFDEDLIVQSADCEISIPSGKWHKFTQANRGREVAVKIALLRSGKWEAYEPLKINFAKEDIDSHIVYRLIRPSYTLWNEMGIYQRELATFDQKKIIDNHSNQHGCMNCHTFADNSPERMMLHIRKFSGGTVVAKDGKVQKYTTKTGSMYADGVYPSWSRDGRYLALSTNETRQNFHTAGQKPIDVFDLRSEIVVMDTQTEEMILEPKLFVARHWDTFPEWDNTGSYLYFCRADSVDVSTQRNVAIKPRYDLCRIAFDSSTRRFAGDVEVVFAASEMGKSVSFPKISPDGKYLVFTLSDYGNFSVWHPESDLWLLDLSGGGAARPIDEINSPEAESYHCWSLNGNWLLFNSKRMDGRWSRPYIAHFIDGKFGKPFVVPQKESQFYDNQLDSYNIPQFVNGEVKLSRPIMNAINSEARTLGER